VPGRAAGPSLLAGLFEDCQDFVFAHDQELFAVQLDLLARVLAEQNRVAGLDVQRDPGPVFLDLAGADGDDLPLLRLLLGGVGDDDPAHPLLGLLETTDEDPIVQRSDFHRCALRECGHA
jgi:hypothetical protein